MNRQLYIGYLIIGVLYLGVKIIFVSAGYLPSCAIQHGMVPAVITAAVGALFMITKLAHAFRRILLWLMMILPVVVLIVAPTFMSWIHGDGWLAGAHLAVLVIYECLAVAQFSIAVAVKRKMQNAAFGGPSSSSIPHPEHGLRGRS
jgi:hypothetical protein